MRKLSKIGLLILAWIFLHCLWVTHEGLMNFSSKADVAIVLGNAVLDDGTLSPWLQGRVDEALELYRNGQVKKIFASGGIGKNRLPEGDYMRKYLIEHGVDSSAVIGDNLGQNTFLTATNFQALNKQEHFNSAVVVTNFYHITRSKYIVRKLGFKNVEGAYSKYFAWNDWFGLGREFAAFYKYLLVY